MNSARVGGTRGARRPVGALAGARGTEDEEEAMETTEATTTAEAWSEAAETAEATAPWEPLGDPFQHIEHTALTLARKAEILTEARELRSKRKALVEEKKEEAKRFTRAIEALDDELDELLNRAELGEQRTIQAQKELRASNVRVVDVETGQVLLERAAESWELQRELFAAGGNGVEYEGAEGESVEGDGAEIGCGASVQDEEPSND